MGEVWVTLNIHFGGKFVDGPPRKYVGGDVGISNVDRNLFTYVNLIDLIEEIGFPRNSIISHKLPDADLDGGLVMLTGEITLLDMFAIHEGRGAIEVYDDCPWMPNSEDEDELNVPNNGGCGGMPPHDDFNEGDNESDSSGLVMSSDEEDENPEDEVYDVHIVEEVQ